MRKTQKSHAAQLFFTVLFILFCASLNVCMVYASDEIASGTCGADGDNLSWTINSDYSLVIEGSGDMADYDWHTQPWEQYLDDIQSVEIQEGVTSVGDFAFVSGTVSSVRFPDSLRSIGNSAFRNCKSLTTVTIPGSVENLGEQCFLGAAGLRSVTIEEGVTSLAPQVFYDCNKLDTISLPDTLVSVGTEAFAQCYALDHIDLPDSVQTIETKAFRMCAALTSITLPENLITIGDSAFHNTKITQLNLGKYVESIGAAGTYPSTVKSVTVSEENNTFSSIDGVLYSKDLKELVFYPPSKGVNDYTVPDGVEIITSSIKGPNVVTIPASIKEISYVNGDKVYILAENAPSINDISFKTDAKIYVLAGSTGYDTGYWKQFNVIYGRPIEGIRFENSSFEFENETPIQLSVILDPEDAWDDTAITWSSSDENIVTVSTDGLITPVGVGSATITAQLGEFAATCNITVPASAVPTYTASVENGSGSGEYCPGQKVYITDTGSDAYRQFSCWESVSGNVSFDNADSSETFFIMPESDVSVKVVYVPTELGQAIIDKDEAIAAREAAEAELAEAQAELAQAKADFAQAKADLLAAQADLQTAQADLQAAQADLQTAQNTIAALNETIASMDETIAQKEAAAAEAIQRVGELTQEKAALEEQLANANTAKEELQAELDGVNAELETAKQAKADAETALATAQTEKQQAIDARDAAIREKEAAEATAKEAEARAKEAEAEAREAEAEAREAEAEVERLKAQINSSNIKAAIISGLSDATYTGAEITPKITVKLNDKELVEGTDYTVYYVKNIAVGTATVIVTGEGSYDGVCKATFKINKAANTLTVKAKAQTLKYKAVKKKKQTIEAAKAFTVTKAQGKVTYKKTSGNSKITVSSAGKVTVKKGLKKGTYIVKVKVTAAGTANYKAGSKDVTLSIKVK